MFVQNCCTNDGTEDDDTNNSNNDNDTDIPKVIKPDFDNLFARRPTLDDILKPPATPTSTDNTRRSTLEGGVDGRGAANKSSSADFDEVQLYLMQNLLKKSHQGNFNRINNNSDDDDD